MNGVDYYSISILGGREHNEDYTVESVMDDRMCFIVCDGLGGQGKGNLASSLVAQSIRRSFESEYRKQKFLEYAFMEAERELVKKKKELGFTREMMTTAVALVCDGNRAFWCHTGDSRLYYFNKNRLVTRTNDHSVPQMLAISGEIKEKDIRFHPDRNRLLKVMGTGWSDLEADVSEEIEMEKGQAFLLCSDGFWENIDEKNMIRLLKNSSGAKEWVESMGEFVCKHATKSMDNASAIGIKIR